MNVETVCVHLCSQWEREVSEFCGLDTKQAENLGNSDFRNIIKS